MAVAPCSYLSEAVVEQRLGMTLENSDWGHGSSYLAVRAARGKCWIGKRAMAMHDLAAVGAIELRIVLLLLNRRGQGRSCE